MTRDEITDTIRRTVAEQFSVPLGEVTLDTLLKEDLGSDSLDCVELTMALEDDFGIHIEDDEADAASKVSQLVDLVTVKLDAKRA